MHGPRAALGLSETKFAVGVLRLSFAPLTPKWMPNAVSDEIKYSCMVMVSEALHSGFGGIDRVATA